MKLQYETKSIYTVDIDLPVFRDYGGALYKFIDEKKCIQVDMECCGDFDIGIKIHPEKHPCYTADILKKGKEITEQQFEQKLQEVREKIYSFIQNTEEVIS